MTHEVISELKSSDSFYTHYALSPEVRQCAHEILLCELSGQLRYDFLYTKANELICYLEAENKSLVQAKTPSTRKISANDKATLEKAKSAIVSAPGNDHKIETLSKLAEMNRNKFISLFKEYFKTSVHEFVMNVRMKKAKELLEETDLSIIKIYQQVGYREHSGFNRAFRKVYGVNPTKMRK